MSTLAERDALIKRCWADPKLRVPDEDPRGPHYPVHVWGVVRDPLLYKRGLQDHVDMVAWWPAAKKWTATFVSPLSNEATDHEVVVVAWQPSPPLPW